MPYVVYHEVSNGYEYHRVLDKTFNDLKEAEEYTEDSNLWVDSSQWVLMSGLIGYRERYVIDKNG